MPKKCDTCNGSIYSWFFGHRRLYDSIRIEERFKNSAGTFTNKTVAEGADLVGFVVNKTKSGAYSAMKYAEKQKVNIINLSDTHRANIGHKRNIRDSRKVI